MLRTLYARLALVMLALFCIVGGIYIALTLVMTRSMIEETNQKLHRDLAATIAKEKPVMRDGRIDQPMLAQVFDALMSVNPSIEIYLLDDSGKILAFSAPEGKVKRT